MKSLNYSALGQIGFEDLGSFLYWLERRPAGEVTLKQMQEGAPVRTSKLKPILKTLGEMKCIVHLDGRVRITSSGENFSRCQLPQKKLMVREYLKKQEPVELVSKLLEASPSSHLKRRVVREVFSKSHGVEFGEYELNAFISWGQACDLFLYDCRKEVLFLANPLQPTGNHDNPRDLNYLDLRLAS